MTSVDAALDVEPFNHFVSKMGKKSINEEFEKKRFIKMTNALTARDPLQGYAARANLEIYFCNYDSGISFLKQALEMSNNTYQPAWFLLLDAYVKLGNWEKALQTFYSMLEYGVDGKERFEVFFHLISIYLDLSLFENVEVSKENQELFDTHKRYITKNIEMLKEYGVTLEVYRLAISLIYRTYFSVYNGKITPVIKFDDSAFIVSYINVYDAVELYDLNDLLTDKVMEIYAEIDESTRLQLENLNFFYQSDSQQHGLEVLA